MITIGLSGFTDHPELLGKSGGLTAYARYFPVVEIDSTAYGLPRAAVVTNWLNQVPATFQFIVKATQQMTRHVTLDRAATIQAFAEFDEVFAPMISRGQMQTILFQMPPQFAATPANIRYLALIRQWLPDLAIAVELRHHSWFAPAMRDSTLTLLRDNQLENVVVDEPQAPNRSIPFVPELTAGDNLFVRLHGRNQAGWVSGERKERTNYDYTDSELLAIADATTKLAPNTTFIFNNNGDHAAARNALRLQELLGVEFDGLAPRQLDLF